MKKLQNNFTTPEQSKRLLELGVPTNSADCYLDAANNRRGMLAINGIYEKDVPTNMVCEDGSQRYLPCWSAGRLIEIHDICVCDLNTQYGWAMAGDYDYINYIISRFEDDIMDFSKFED